MKLYSALSLVLTASLLIAASSAVAQSVDSYLQDKSDAAWQIQIITPAQALVSPNTFFGKIRLLLGIRKLSRVKPPLGTQLIVQASAYAPSPYQTDSSPCITAAGTKVRPGVVATNFLPMGTILEIAGEKFIVEDRMNSRYEGYFMDIWFPSTSSALEFGRKKLNITIVGYGDPGDNVRSVSTDSAQAEDKGFWSRLKNKLVSGAEYLTTKVTGNVNKHDVNCDAEATS